MNEATENSQLDAELLLANEAVLALENKKALDVKKLSIGSKTVMADYFVIATGTSTTHVDSLADEVAFQLKDKLNADCRKEGKAGWILLDFGTVIVHIFTKEAREYYKLEKLWEDKEGMKINEV